MSGVFKHDRLRARWGAGLASLGVAALALLASGAGASARAETVTGVTQYGYDVAGRQICATTRMNPAAFSAAVSACSLGTAGTDGPDRITYTEYDTVNRVTKLISGYASGDPRIEKAVTYTDNGQVKTLADGNRNLTTYEYDGLDRLVKERFPSPSTPELSSTTDYNEYGYDAAGNRTSWRQRDGTPLSFTFDALNRANNGVRGETYAYDNLGRRTSATYLGQTASAAYDALGRMTSETTNGLTMSYQYDLAGRRTRITWPDTFYAAYEYDVVGELKTIREGSAGGLLQYSYDDQGRLTQRLRGNGTSSNYGYDVASRLSCLRYNAACAASGAPTWAFAYNAAGQVKSRVAADGTYEWTGTQTSKTYGVNGLNQMTSLGGTSLPYDGRGNLANDSARALGYDALNDLTSAGTATLAYEPTGRLWQVSAGTTSTQFLYAGSDLVGEYSGSTLLHRYVPGPGPDTPEVWYQGGDTSARRYLQVDAQGSVVAALNDAAVAITTSTYDEYGVASGNVGRFQYTGQIWIPEAGVYHYKARAYSPTLGRFLQTDPIGYGDGLNWYAYVGNDPLNQSDPTGLLQYSNGSEGCVMNCPDGGSISAPLPTVTGADGKTHTVDAPTNPVSTPEADYLGKGLVDWGIGATEELGGAFLEGGLGPEGLWAAGAFNAGAKIAGATEAAAPLVTTNRIAGNAARDTLALGLRAEGRTAATEVYKWTPFGKRFIDIEVSLGGRVLGGIEVKVGGSRYIPAQRAKDAWLRIVEGYRVNVVRVPK